MTQALTLPLLSGTSVPNGVIAVDCAIGELRRGRWVAISSSVRREDLLIVQAAEAVTSQGLNHLTRLSGQPVALALTLRRSMTLGLIKESLSSGIPPADLDPTDVMLMTRPALEAETVLTLIQPGRKQIFLQSGSLSLAPWSAHSIIGAAVKLTKLARLIPAAIVTALFKGSRVIADIMMNASPAVGIPPQVSITVEDIDTYDQVVIRTLRPVSEAHVPLASAEDTRIVAFRPGDGGTEHLAIIVGAPDSNKPVLARLHSECFTGDLLGSLRCDCGNQLRGAITAIAAVGAGVLLYLAQEGRGIGLVNKLRAYQLQDCGFDTLDANGQLGFDDDERIYLPAAEMLRQLGFRRVRLMTNNPRKVESLVFHGIDVVDRVPHIFPASNHSLSYIYTKATKGGHLF